MALDRLAAAVNRVAVAMIRLADSRATAQARDLADAIQRGQAPKLLEILRKNL